MCACSKVVLLMLSRAVACHLSAEQAAGHDCTAHSTWWDLPHLVCHALCHAHGCNPPRLSTHDAAAGALARLSGRLQQVLRDLQGGGRGGMDLWSETCTTVASCAPG